MSQESKGLFGVTVAIMVAASALLGVITFLVSANPPAPAPPPLATRLPEGPVKGPYLPWPISFPKMLPGFVLLERQGLPLALSSEQAREMIPHVRAMAEAWTAVRDVEIKMRGVLNFRQDLYVSRRKHEFEMSTAMERLQSLVGEVQPGENLNLLAALAVLEPLAGEPSEALRAKVQAYLEAPLRPEQYVQKPGSEWLTVFDISMGIVHLVEEAEDDLRLTPEQAAQLRPLVEAARAPIRQVSQHEQALADAFEDSQIRFIQDHMQELYQIRTREFAYPGEASVAEDAYHDVLFQRALEFLEKKESAPPESN